MKSLRLPWRRCVCGHYVTQHAVWWPSPRSTCAGNFSRCHCSKFKDHSLWQRIRWALFRVVGR